MSASRVAVRLTLRPPRISVRVVPWTPSAQEGQGNGDIQRREGDIPAGVLGGQQLVEAEGKVAALEADLRLSTGVLLRCSPSYVLLVKHAAPEAVDSGAEPSHQESRNQEG